MNNKVVNILLFFCVLMGLCFNLTHTHARADNTTSPEHKTVLLIGVDTGFGRTEHGRADVMAILDLNLTDETGVIASIPRDSYVEIPGYGLDKLNHAYAYGGADLVRTTINQWLDIQIDDYLAVNMSGLIEMVDSVGEITVVPPTSFSIGQYSFEAGVETVLTPEMALQYARERYTSGGDYARQERQRDIILAILDQLSDIKSVMEMSQLFLQVNDNIDTNIAIPQLYHWYREARSLINQIETFQLQGSGVMIDGVYYEEIHADSLEQLLFYLKS